MTKKNKTAGKRRKSTAVRPASEAPGAGPRRRFPRLRKWGARLLAVVLAPTLFFAVVELVLWLFGYGYDASYFIKAEDGKAYVSNPQCTRPYFGPELARPPVPTVVSPEKPQRTYRIFVFGGSAAQGIPDPAFAFSRLLEVMLEERFGQTRFEVINTAMVAINSHVVLPTVKECSDFDADLYVVYLGNNEVVGPYGAGTVFGSPGGSLSLIRTGIFVRRTRVGQLIGNSIRALAAEDPEARKEWGGMRMFLEHRVAADDPKLQTVYDHFAANLEDICAEARDAGVPIIVSTVLTNLKDCPPLHSMHRRGLSTGEKARWNGLYRQAAALQDSGDRAAALQQYLAAAQIDGRFAELHFRIGECCLAAERFDDARKHFVLARDLDTLRFRADTQINRIIRRVAGSRGGAGVSLVEPEHHRWFRQEIPHGIPGAELLYEHVHLNFAGNYLVAATVFDEVVRLLPKRIRQTGPAQPRPPSLERCAERATFTLFNRFFAATRIAAITHDPPFAEAHGRRSMAAVKRLEAQLTPEVLDRIAAAYRTALDGRPDDLLLRNVFALLQSVRKEHVSAAKQYRRLIRSYPHRIDWRYQLGLALAGQDKTSEAVAEFRAVIAQNPYHVEAHTGLAAALAKTDKLDAAIQEYERAVSIRPDQAETRFQLGLILLRRGRPVQAEKHLAAAVEADPTAPRFHFYLGRALVRQNKLDQALEAFQEEVAVFPGNPLAQLELGDVFLARKQPGGVEKAIGHYSQALDLDGNLVPALNNLAWLLATHREGHLRNGSRAVRLAQWACQLIEPPPATLLDTLAAAYAEAGRFDRAVETAEEAVALAEEASKGRAADPIRTRLDLYRQQKPFRDASR